MHIIIPDDFYTKVRDKHLLLDTSFFIDASSEKLGSAFEKFISESKNRGVTFWTITSVVVEFLKGRVNKLDIRARKEFIDLIVDSYLTLTPDILTDILIETTQECGEHSSGMSVTDLFLTSTLKKYTSNLLLVTKNRKDFLNKHVELVTYFLLDGERDLQVYALLRKQ